jgi:hypothetical protein
LNNRRRHGAGALMGLSPVGHWRRSLDHRAGVAGGRRWGRGPGSGCAGFGAVECGFDVFDPWQCRGEFVG